MRFIVTFFDAGDYCKPRELITAESWEEALAEAKRRADEEGVDLIELAWLERVR